MSTTYQQIFLSHCVSSCGEKAGFLKELLDKNGFTTFLCRDMEGGASFQLEIMGNALNCKVMVVFVEENWERSGECKAEFNNAWSFFKQKQCPKIVPIMVGGFGWKTPEHIYANTLTCNFQCIPLTGATQEEWEESFKRVIDACRSILSGDSIRSVIKSYTDCEICSKPFQNPKQLPCSHSFCTNCLTNLKGSKSSLNCPKCEVVCYKDIELLEENKTAAQLVKVQTQISTGEKPTSSKLEKWFDDNEISSSARRVLRKSGYENLDIVTEDLELEELKNLPGMKPGHYKKIWKSILAYRKASNEAQSVSFFEDLSGSPLDWELVNSLFNDRVLRSGTMVPDSTKFWLKFSEKVKNDFVDKLRNLAYKVHQDPCMRRSEKSDKLHKLAMILCIATLGPDGEFFAGLSMNHREMPDGFDKQYLETKVLKTYAMQIRLKQGRWITQEGLPDWKANLEHCNQVLKDGKGKLDENMLCKVMQLKLFAIKNLNNRNFQHGENLPALLAETAERCQQLDDKGLFAEYLLNEALTYSDAPKEISKLLEARKACVDSYGEYSELVSRIYCFLGLAFRKLDHQSKEYLAYECFRRHWISYRQFFGLHHTATESAAKRLVENREYRRIAEEKGDSLPSDETITDTPSDRDVESRLKDVLRFAK